MLSRPSRTKGESVIGIGEYVMYYSITNVVLIGTMGSQVRQARGPRHDYNLTKGSVVSKIS